MVQLTAKHAKHAKTRFPALRGLSAGGEQSGDLRTEILAHRLVGRELGNQGTEPLPPGLLHDRQHRLGEEAVMRDSGSADSRRFALRPPRMRGRSRGRAFVLSPGQSRRRRGWCLTKRGGGGSLAGPVRKGGEIVGVKPRKKPVEASVVLVKALKE